ncbi:MAG TPA: cation:proton antiporter [Candidatus Saccharimonadales bacterium]|nr:cation:proton antiporter [Candidatus Saccharimonadales bacterium]
MDSVFSELSLVIIVTAAVSLFMRLIRQPLILGYILAGLLVGPAVLGLIHSEELFHVFSEIGIALLLFIIGLGMNITELKKLGRVVGFVTLATFMTITTVGFGTSSLLGFSKSEALIIGLALFFSSTIIIVKILSDKKEQNRLHGQIAIGVILLDDIVATFALLFVAANRGGESLQPNEIVLLLGKGILLLAFLALCSSKILPRISRYMAETQELLFLFAISWGFGIATLFNLSGFSIEVGALFGGVALASSPYVQEIASRLKPLRDFFVVIFFITLGESLNTDNMIAGILPAIILSLIVMIIKPLVVTASMGLLGYTKRVSFKAAINLSQISEFSIVLVVLAIDSGVVRPELGAIITLVAIITIATSTYLMQYDDVLFTRWFDRIKLHVFEKEVTYRESKHGNGYPILLLGYHHGGHEFVHIFKQMKHRFLVVDYDPEIIELMQHQKVDYLYGDVTDTELLDEAQISKSKLIVSTISDHSTNVFLANLLGKVNPGAVFICHGDNVHQATELYDLGVSYVMIPHYIGSEKIGAFIKRVGLKKSEFKKFRDKHLVHLETHAPITKNDS